MGQRGVSTEFVIDWMWREVDFSLWRMNEWGCHEQREGTPWDSRWEFFFYLRPLKEQFWISQMAQKGLVRGLHLYGTLRTPLSAAPRNPIAVVTPWEA